MQYVVRFKNWKYILISLAGFVERRASGRVFCSLNQSGFSFNSVFFPFGIHCCFTAILKTSADTNAGQSRSWLNV